MAVIQSLGALIAQETAWSPSYSYGSLRMYNAFNYDYATLYKTQPNIRTCVDFLSRNIAQLGLHVFQRVSETDRRRLRDHPLAELIEEPLPPEYKVTRYRLIESTISDLGIYFNALWLIVNPGVNAWGLVRIPWPWVQIKKNLLPTYEISLGGRPEAYSSEQVVHFRGYNPEDTLAGLSPLETLRRILAEEHAAGDYREHFWANSARMNGIIMRPAEAPEWSHTAKERFMAEFAQLYSGGDNSGKTAMFEEGMTWKETSFNAQESEYLAGRKLTREECARAYHIPLPMVGILDNATFCLPGYVPVFTAQGPRPISDVKAGDHVWSLGETGFYLKRVLRSGQTGIDPILRIKTQNRTLDCNYTHPILVRRLIKVLGFSDETANLKKKAGQSRWHYEDIYLYIPASDIRRGDVLVTAFQLGGVGPDRQSLARMEFLGLYVGDGNLTRNGGKPSGISIARGEHALYMDHYRRVMSEFTGRSGRRVALDEQARQTRMCSVEAARLMVTLGFSGTAHEKRVPGWVFESSFEARFAFLRGYLDADGSVDKKGRISFSSCNRDLIEDVRHLCMSVGVPVNNIYNFRGKTTLPNGRVVDACSWTITCADPGANRLIGSNDPRYLLRLAGGKPFGRKRNEYPFARGRRSSPPMGCSYSRVVSIEPLPEQPVFDIEVEDTHNFVAAGVVVHNSNIREQHKNLYQDSLGPWLSMLEADIALQLLPRLDSTPGVYVEFNIAEKLQGSFEEQVQSLQSSVGAPWLTRDEARARMNLPSMGGDAAKLVVPLNVLIGGQASPRDSAPPPKALTAGTKARREGQIDPSQPGLRERHEVKWTQVMAHHFKRQQDTIVGKVPEKAAKATIAQLWDAKRWDSELHDDIYRLNVATATVWAKHIADQLDIELDSDRMLPWLEENSRIAAEEINATTRDGLIQALKDDAPRAATLALFALAIDVRAPEIAASKVTTASTFGSFQGAEQAGLRTKTWQTNSANPREAHAALDGETVALDERFSNGQLWPGDPAGGAENNANCRCSVTFGRE